jgi:hypothetical protein
MSLLVVSEITFAICPSYLVTWPHCPFYSVNSFQKTQLYLNHLCHHHSTSWSNEDIFVAVGGRVSAPLTLISKARAVLWTLRLLASHHD